MNLPVCRENVLVQHLDVMERMIVKMAVMKYHVVCKHILIGCNVILHILTVSEIGGIMETV